MGQHIQILAAIYIALGSIGGFIALIVFVAVAGGGLLSGDPTAMTITTIVGASIAAFFVILSAPAIITGVGLFRRRSWASTDCNRARLFAVVGCAHWDCNWNLHDLGTRPTGSTAIS